MKAWGLFHSGDSICKGMMIVAIAHKPRFAAATPVMKSVDSLLKKTLRYKSADVLYALLRYAV